MPVAAARVDQTIKKIRKNDQKIKKIIENDEKYEHCVKIRQSLKMTVEATANQCFDLF